MRSPVRIWVAAPKKHLRMQVLFGLSAFRLLAGDIRFAVRWAQLPAACPALRSDFRGALHGGCYPRLQARGALHAFFHYYKSQIARDCGAAVPPRLRFRCRVRDFAAVCGFFICRGVAADSGENAGFTPESFFRRWDALALCAPLVCRKNFSADARCRARVLFRRIFRSDREGRKCVRQSFEKRHILQV